MAIWRGDKRPTLVTAGKQPKKVPSGHGETAEKQPEERPKHPKNSCFDCFGCLSGCFFSCFYRHLPVTHSAHFSAVLMSGIWHLCRWPQRLQKNYWMQLFVYSWKLPACHSPRNFYKLIPLPVFLYFFFVIFTGMRCGVDIARKANKSGQILDKRWIIFFCNFYEICSSQDFFVLQTILVLMV